jgi:hypothetical protein
MGWLPCMGWLFPGFWMLPLSGCPGHPARLVFAHDREAA